MGSEAHPRAVRLTRYPVRTHANALEYGSRFASRVWREADPELRKSGKLAVHFDIDSTLFDESKVFVLDDEEYLMPNRDIVKLLRHCWNLGLKVIIITARSREGKEYTKTQLKLFNILHHQLIFSGHKAEWKKALYEKHGIRTIMSVGDSLIDVQGSHAGEPILLKTPGHRSFR